jgi:hypothetical protein
MTDEEDYIDPSLDDYDIHKLENKPVGLEVYIERTLVEKRESEEEYGDWYEEYYNFFKSANIATNMPDVVTKLPLKHGDEIYVVWVEWTTGNSFGSSNCGQSEVLGVFKDYNAAAELESFIRDSEHYEEVVGTWRIPKVKADEMISRIKSPHKVTYEFQPSNYNSTNGNVRVYLHTSDGQSFSYSYFPWTGYFEKLENVYINQTTIEYIQ